MNASSLTFTLANGLRVVCRQTDSEVVYCGYVVGAGTRHEAPEEVGMAHLAEHMVFKGTEHRRALQVNRHLERVGGSLNASTNKQHTLYSATVMQQDFRRAVDILSDIVFHATCPGSELEKEVEVVCDEIDSYEDSPSDLIFDDFESLLFPRHPLGRDILGDKERLRSYGSEDVLRFLRRYYVPNNVTFFCDGNVSPSRILRTLEQFTADLPPVSVCKPQPALPEPKPERIVREKHLHQSHVVVGCRTVSGQDERRYALTLLTNLLGGDEAMSSRLNIALRERTGLVYTCDAYSYAYPDAGVFQIYFGCDAADASRCRRLVTKELQRLAAERLRPATLAAIKKQQLAARAISAENRESRIHALARIFADCGRVEEEAETRARIEALTAEELQDFAADFFNPDRMTTLIYQ